jgi:hypothetical protein
MSRKLFFISALMCAVVLTGQGCPTDSPADTEPQTAPTPGSQQLPTQGTSERGDTSQDQQDDQQESADEPAQQEEAEGGDLSQNEQQLVGTWRHVRTEGGINPGPVAPDVIEWTFNADGTGTYFQDPETDFVEASERDINWKLDGNDIIFTDESGAGSPQYRVDKWGEDQMRWHNYTLGDTYIVERQ